MSSALGNYVSVDTGGVADRIQTTNSDAGYAESLFWPSCRFAPGPPITAAAEGTRSYGVGVARALNAAGVWVIEWGRGRSRRRARGRSDPIDAHLAVRWVLSRPVAAPPFGGIRSHP